MDINIGIFTVLHHDPVSNSVPINFSLGNVENPMAHTPQIGDGSYIR